MQDAISIGIAIRFIALCVAYVRGLDALVSPTLHEEERGRAVRGLRAPPGARSTDRVLPRRRFAVPGEVLVSSASWVQFGALVAVLLATAPPLGRYIALVYGDGGKAPVIACSSR